MSKPLIIICEDNEGNAALLADRAGELGADVRMLLDSAYGERWFVTVASNHDHPTLVDRERGVTYSLADPQLCYYLRSPHFFENHKLAQPYSLIYEYLETAGYRIGNYLMSSKGHSMGSSKPINMLQLSQVQVPASWVGHHIPSDLFGSSQYIIKGLSSVRTQAVSLADPRILLQPEMRQSTPVLIQERIRGKDIKTVFYRLESGAFIYLPTTPTNHENLVDYRFQEDFGLELCRENIPWQTLGQELFTKVKSRFFDADFILTPEGELFFLEVNLGPSGIAEEKQIADESVDFSRRMLADWLMLPWE